MAKPSTEKTNKVPEQAGIPTPPKTNSSDAHENKQSKPGHGRNGAAGHRGARRIPTAHATLKPGDRCPRCLKGRVYEQKEPVLRIRVVGQAPLAATLYEPERLRCNLCGDVFEAAAAMIGVLRYASGMPWHRLEGLEGSLGIPLPASTQWEIVEKTAEVLRPAGKS